MTKDNDEYWKQRAGDVYEQQQVIRSFQGSQSYRQQEVWLINFLRRRSEFLKRPVRTLDFGCGFGRLTRLLIGEPFVNYYGYDFSRSMTAPLFQDPPVDIDELKTRIRIAPSVSEAYAGERFDFVFTISTLIHNDTASARTLLEGMADLLTTEGQICLIENQLSAISLKENNWHGGCWVHDVANDLAPEMHIRVIPGVVEGSDIYLLSSVHGAMRELRICNADGEGAVVSPEVFAFRGLERTRLALSHLAEEHRLEAQAASTGMLHDFYELSEIQKVKLAEQAKELRVVKEELARLEVSRLIDKVSGMRLAIAGLEAGGRSQGERYSAQEQEMGRQVELGTAVGTADQSVDALIDALWGDVQSLMDHVKRQGELLSQLEMRLAAGDAWSRERKEMLHALTAFRHEEEAATRSAHSPESQRDSVGEVGFYDWMAPRDVSFANENPAFAGVCHVMLRDWLGIRSAVGSLPGHKLAISSSRRLTPADARAIRELLLSNDISKIVLHGMSDGMRDLVLSLRKGGLPAEFYLVWHGTTAQWVWSDERRFAHMAIKMARDGEVKRFNAIRRGLHEVVGVRSYAPQLLNMPPKTAASILKRPARRSRQRSILVPSWNDLRKNLATNVLAGECVKAVSKIYVIAEDFSIPRWLTSKVRKHAFINHFAMIDMMAAMDCVMNVTTIDCHPMVDLEALAVGTPAIRGPLHLDALEDHPYTQVTSVDNPMSVSDVAARLRYVLSMPVDELGAMMSDYKDNLLRIANQRYMEFLDI